jgi:Xaa-Pro aminopeptidase
VLCHRAAHRAPGIGGANYENNVIVTDAGPEIVTPAPDRYGE